MSMESSLDCISRPSVKCTSSPSQEIAVFSRSWLESVRIELEVYKAELYTGKNTQLNNPYRVVTLVSGMKL